LQANIYHSEKITLDSQMVDSQMVDSQGVGSLMEDKQVEDSLLQGSLGPGVDNHRAVHIPEVDIQLREELADQCVTSAE
jgi:hypothetical protein